MIYSIAYSLFLFFHLISPPIQPLYNIPKAYAAIVQFHDLEKESGQVCEANKGFWEFINGATITFPSSTNQLTQTMFLCGDNITFNGANVKMLERVPFIEVTVQANKDTLENSHLAR